MGPSSSYNDDESGSEESLPQEPIPLADIVSHFVASKQSLAATSHVYRANEIVNEARSLLETLATFDAKTSFLGAGIKDQLAIVTSIRAGLGTVAEGVDTEYQATIRELDEANASIEKAVTELQSTKIEACFRLLGSELQSLHSFVDSQAIDELHAFFRDCIDKANEAKTTFVRSTTAFDDGIAQVETSLAATNVADVNEQPVDSIDSLYAPPSQPQTPATLFNTLEAHAAETATLLQGLIHHYDLCVTALKHTEGGATAAIDEVRATLPKDAAADVRGALTSSAHSQSDTPAMSETERAHLLHVLDKDASQLPDVLAEIRERAEAMETAFSSLAKMAETRRARATTTQNAISAIDSLGVHLPQYTAAASTYTTAWNTVSTQIQTKLSELLALRDFFAGFRDAYDVLLLEVGQRKETRRQMDAIAAETRRQLSELYDGEVRRREEFRAECGVFLPRDLWEGFEDPPSLFTVERVDDGTVDIPEVRGSVLRRARERKEKLG